MIDNTIEESVESPSTPDSPTEKNTQETNNKKMRIFKKWFSFKGYLLYTILLMTAVFIGSRLNIGDKIGSESTETEVPVSSVRKVIAPPSIDDAHPWNHYITTEQKRSDLLLLTDKIEKAETLKSTMDALQESLTVYNITLKTIVDYSYGDEASSVSEDDIEYIKTFGIVLIDEIYKYPTYTFEKINVDNVQLASGFIKSGNRSGLNGLAHYSNRSIIYNVTPGLSSEHNGRQQYSPFNENFLRLTIHHEIGHFTHNLLNLHNTNYSSAWREWESILPQNFVYLMSCEDQRPLANAEAPIPSGFLKANSTTCPAEDWADTFADLILRGGAVRSNSNIYVKAKQEFIKNKLLPYHIIIEQ